MTRSLVEKCVVKSRMLRARDRNNTNMVPVMSAPALHPAHVSFIRSTTCVRKPASAAGWKSRKLVPLQGKNSPIFIGGLGMINNCVLHSRRRHPLPRLRCWPERRCNPRAVPRPSRLVSSPTVRRAACATWKEETDDFGNEPVVAAGVHSGREQVKFNERDFGVISVDTAATDPNA